MGSSILPFGKPMRDHFIFDPAYTPINHGSYGASPKAVLEAQRKFQAELDGRPDWYIRYGYPAHLREARLATAKLLDVDVDEIVLVQNATTAYNTILRSLTWKEGDVVLYYNIVYGTLHKTLKYLEETTPLKAKCIQARFPCTDDELVQNFEDAIRQARAAGQNPRVACYDTIASMPGLRIPFERLTQKCKKLDILSLVDGAHGVGQISIDLLSLEADFFLSNLHKWLFVPRGCAVLHVPKRHQHLVRSSIPTSDGFRPLDGTATNNLFPTRQSSFVELFEFIGTVESQNYLTVPHALRFRNDVCGGEDAIREYCFKLAREGGRRVAEILGTEEMDHPNSCARECAFTNVRLPIEIGEGEGQLKQEHLAIAKEFITHQSCVVYDTYIAVREHDGALWTRLSAQIYLEVDDYEKVAEVARKICETLLKPEEFVKDGICARCADEGVVQLESDLKSSSIGP